MGDRYGEEGQRPTRGKPVERLNNQQYLLALDGALHAGLGLQLSDFVASTPLCRLEHYEREYFLPADEVDPTFARPVDDFPGRRRCYVLNRRTGESRLRLPMILDTSQRVWRPAIHISSDDGPIGRPACHFMFKDLKVRGTRIRDHAHKMHNLTKNATVQSGLWIVVLESVVGFNLPGGPWEGDAFYRSFTETGRQFLHESDHRNPVFQFFYERIAMEQGNVCMGFLTDEHMRAVWEGLYSCKTLARKGSKVKLGRWLGWHRATKEKRHEWSIYVMFLVVLGMRKGMWTDVWDSPVLGNKARGGWDLSSGGDEDVADAPLDRDPCRDDAPKP